MQILLLPPHKLVQENPSENADILHLPYRPIWMTNPQHLMMCMKYQPILWNPGTVFRSSSIPERDWAWVSSTSAPNAPKPRPQMSQPIFEILPTWVLKLHSRLFTAARSHGAKSSSLWTPCGTILCGWRIFVKCEKIWNPKLRKGYSTAARNVCRPPPSSSISDCFTPK